MYYLKIRHVSLLLLLLVICLWGPLAYPFFVSNHLDFIFFIKIYLKFLVLLISTNFFISILSDFVNSGLREKKF